jgi:hypothetical protein
LFSATTVSLTAAQGSGFAAPFSNAFNYSITQNAINMHRQINLLLAAVLITSVLSACGGGDDENTPCGGTGNLSLTLAYEINGQLVNPSVMTLRTGTAVQAVPKAVGLPAACNAAARWTFAQLGSSRPAGLAFDPATGVVSGTPTGTGFLTVDMTLRVDGYAFSVNERAVFAVLAGQ